MSNVKILHGKSKKEIVELLEKSMSSHGAKLFTGERVMHCDIITGKRSYKIGLVEEYGGDD